MLTDFVFPERLAVVDKLHRVIPFVISFAFFFSERFLVRILYMNVADHLLTYFQKN